MATLTSLLGACGGGGGDIGSGGANTDSKVAVNTLSGSVVKGPVDGASVCAFALLANGKGKLIDCTTSRADGSYSFDLNHSGPVVVEATGGRYTDEATGLEVELSTPLTAVGRLISGNNSLMATPLTSIAFNQSVSGGSLSVDGHESAARSVKTAFGLGDEVDLARTLPEVTTDQINSYGHALVGISKMVKSGSSLADLLASQSLQGLGHNYQFCMAPAVDLSVDIQVTLSVDVPVSASPTLIEVTGPDDSWRATLPGSGVVNQSACQVLENTASP